MTTKLESPHRFSERILLFGGGGAGKTNTVLNIATHMARGKMYVVDADYSLAYDRALATEYEGVDENVEVVTCAPEWGEFIEAVQEAMGRADTEAGDWVVIDPVSASWDWVQEATLETIYGEDLTSMLVQLRKMHGKDSRAYAKAVSELMNWPLVKKEYGKLWRAIQGWKGHLVVVAEAKAVGGMDDDETKMLYGPLGFKPAGEKRLSHVASTTLFLDHPKRDKWRATTIKDRNRDEMDKEQIEDFGLDYLMGYAGWERVRGGKKDDKGKGGES